MRTIPSPTAIWTFLSKDVSYIMGKRDTNLQSRVKILTETPNKLYKSVGTYKNMDLYNPFSILTVLQT